MISPGKFVAKAPEVESLDTGVGILWYTTPHHEAPQEQPLGLLWSQQTNNTGRSTACLSQNSTRVVGFGGDQLGSNGWLQLAARVELGVTTWHIT